MTYPAPIPHELRYKAGEEVRTLPCLHFYHTPCIDPWLLLDGTCPACKTGIAPGQVPGITPLRDMPMA